VDALYDTGPYDHLGGVVMTLGLEHAGGPYQIPHSSLRGRAVYTNNPVGGAFRGFGVPQVTAALEQTMDILAAKLKMDPLELRARNLAAKGQTIPAGVSLNCSNGLPQCLKQAAAHPLWKEKQAWQDRAPLFKRRGVGVAAMMHGMGYGPVVPDVAQAKIELTAQGGFRLYSGVVDMGQGNANTYLQMAGHLLNQDPAGLGLVLPDTDKTLPCGSASASRTTFTYGNALILACQDLQRSIKEQAAKILGIDDPEEIRMEPGLAGHPPTGKNVKLADLAKDMPSEQRMAVREYRAPISPDPPIADEALRLHGFAHAIFSFGVQMASVEVDELTGKIEIKDFVSITDCGRVLNPPLLEQQMHGALAQGLGYALHEDFISQEGLTLTPDLSTYIIPTAMDLPDFETSFVQANEPAGPFGLKGAGELGCDGPLPAVANALADACGMRPERFPLTPERVLLALRSEANQEKEK
jgi:CO/xanthine dehydrogenase Mo-binding subunit